MVADWGAAVSFDDTEKSVDESAPRELFKFTRGPNVWSYTSTDETVNFGGRVYTKASITRTGVEHSREDTAGGIKITMDVANPVAAQFVGFPPSDTLFVTVYRVHRNGATAVQFFGSVAEWRTDGPEATLTCVPLDGALTRQVPTMSYQRQCMRTLYGPGCDVAPLPFRTAAVLSNVTGKVVMATAFASKPDGWFTGGWVEIVDGPRAGDRRFIQSHTGNALTLSAPFAEVFAGNNVYAFAGCDREETTCAAKFNNLPKHGGFSRIPILNPHAGRMT